MVRNFIIVRRTLPWDTITWNEFLQRTFLHTEKLVYKFIIPLLQHWDKCCGLSYFQYRAGLKAIAEATIRAIPGARIKQIQWYDSFLKRSRDTVVTFVDDDDWVAPNLFTSVRLADCRASRVFVWNNTFLEYARPTYCYGKFGDDLAHCHCLQYAMLGPVNFKGAYSANLLGKVDTHTNWHVNAVLKHISRKHVTIVPGKSSISVRSLGSISQLKRFIAASGAYEIVNDISEVDARQSVHNFEEAIRNWVEIDTIRIASDLEWSVGYAERLNELNRRTFGLKLWRSKPIGDGS